MIFDATNKGDSIAENARYVGKEWFGEPSGIAERQIIFGGAENAGS
jgi:hypothetical protein